VNRAPPRPGSAVSIELEIPFHDVDALQVVWHGHYCKYIEIAQTALLRSRQLDARDILGMGYRLFVTDFRIRHLFPMRYGERLRVSAWFLDVENRLHIACDLVNLTQDRRCAQARTVLVTTSADGALFFETPAPLLERLRAPGTGRAEP
jgi:acyl-CoA thioester hydrolase